MGDSHSAPPPLSTPKLQVSMETNKSYLMTWNTQQKCPFARSLQESPVWRTVWPMQRGMCQAVADPNSNCFERKPQRKAEQNSRLPLQSSGLQLPARLFLVVFFLSPSARTQQAQKKPPGPLRVARLRFLFVSLLRRRQRCTAQGPQAARAACASAPRERRRCRCCRPRTRRSSG